MSMSRDTMPPWEMRQEMDRQAAEIEKLRAALEYIAEGGLAYPEKHARAALEEK